MGMIRITAGLTTTLMTIVIRRRESANLAKLGRGGRKMIEGVVVAEEEGVGGAAVMDEEEGGGE